MYTFTAYAATPLTVIINSLGQAKSANVLFGGSQLGGGCVTAPHSRITGNLTGAGEFSVNFYLTSDCSGSRMLPIHRYQAQAPGSLVYCLTSALCFFNTLTGAPNNQNSAIAVVWFQRLGNSLSANTLFKGQQQGKCLVSPNVITFPTTGAGEFSVNFYSTSDCSGTRLKFFQYSAQQGSNGVVVVCSTDTNCQCYNTSSGSSC